MEALERVLNRSEYRYHIDDSKELIELAMACNKIPDPIIDYIETNFNDVRVGKGLVTFKEKFKTDKNNG